MRKKLTENEKALIGVVLDYEKGFQNLAEKIGSVFGTELSDPADLVDSHRVEKALFMEGTGDAYVDTVYGYVRGEYNREEVFAVIESFMNNDDEVIKKWLMRDSE